MNHPIQLNDSILITIKRLGINGEGIGYYKRLAVFVEDALPEEVVEVKITEIKEKYVKGVITQIKEKSPNRMDPPCPYFGKCGGCQIQHMNYDTQLIEKKHLVMEAFERYYQGDMRKIPIYDTIGMDEPFFYRNKSSLPLRHDGKKVVAGMYAKNSNHLVFIDECMVESKLINEARKLILDRLTQAQVDIYNPKTKKGILRFLIIRAFEDTKETQVTFVLTKPDRKLIDLLSKLPYTSQNYSINADDKAIELFGKETILVSGKETIQGKLMNLSFSISPMAFYQLNSKQTEVLYEQIKKACHLTGQEKILDCYCGIGSIGMMLAPTAKEVRGIDTNKEGIENAKLFALQNQIGNAFFYAGNILPYMDQFEKEGFIPDIVVVDPPRKGLELNFIQYLQKSKIKKIVYVSCNPATLAKNASHLHKEYIIRWIQPLDMFAQTANVEAVCLLERR